MKEWVDRARNLCPDLFVLKRTLRRERWLKKPLERHFYEVVFKLNNGTEYQIMNFPPVEDGGWSINHHPGRMQVLSYLMGFVNGYDQGNRKDS